jgi:hypothetical protein
LAIAGPDVTVASAATITPRAADMTTGIVLVIIAIALALALLVITTIVRRRARRRR